MDCVDNPRHPVTRALGAFPLVFVGSVLVWAFYSFACSISIGYVLLHRQSGQPSFRWTAEIIIFCTLWFLAVFSLVKVCKLGPGFVRESDHSSTVADEESYSLVPKDALEDRETQRMAKADGSRRYCRKCRLHKPDRAHHCRITGACILKMDHYCPFVFCTIGHRNYKAFILFLGYTSFLGITTAISTGLRLLQYAEDATALDYELTSVNWALLLLIAAMFSLIIVAFTAHHLYMISKNRTTIENVERTNRLRLDESSSEARRWRDDNMLTRDERRKLRKAAAKANIYDLGAKENFKQVFGPWSWRCFDPRVPTPGDGLHFPVNHEHHARLQSLTEAIRLRVDENHV
ncbi:uncharacterized protein L969DRAFT_94107 [Mixia osmundae IAM 14324]|uniref:Palmitoyltransferase n=1 Tax=Mixia osmundae (strain CBS 9802 / IAM 14324 / JCM 22182 / KY 12970) TaxID=764103 RepID=G7E940_MIXOS|nr:uncharacterized protein L969DRAFT_94107 [Mixia osmundae IAM 14324]KEI40294.1 hypothetical protein L969DRAFT_94107 [Mixia osmundae IAM 14324]GAA99658.1 hypothetical protein E5Q_06361 [Mixia osmundae IAM 14324]